MCRCVRACFCCLQCCRHYAVIECQQLEALHSSCSPQVKLEEAWPCLVAMPYRITIAVHHVLVAVSVQAFTHVRRFANVISFTAAGGSGDEGRSLNPFPICSRTRNFFQVRVIVKVRVLVRVRV